MRFIWCGYISSNIGDEYLNTRIRVNVLQISGCSEDNIYITDIK